MEKQMHADPYGIRKHLKYGDVGSIAVALGVSRELVSRVISGKYKNDAVLAKVLEVAEGHKKGRESLLDRIAAVSG